MKKNPQSSPTSPGAYGCVGETEVQSDWKKESFPKEVTIFVCREHSSSKIL